MGVHGLWRLLDSFGTVIQPDDLKGKRVAIDASIWIVQFRSRVGPGEDVEHKILEGFLARILKLLFYGIKPVFVFDGQASSNKGAEHFRRMRQRAANAQMLLKRKAKQILMAQVAAGAIDLEAMKSAMLADADEGGDDDDGAGKTLKGSGRQGVCADGKSAKTKSPPSVAAPVVAESGEGAAPPLPTLSAATTNTDAHHPVKRRRRRGARLPTRRRRRLAPDAVASRSTLHFLQDVEGLIEERSKQEARVLHNALHNTSTSLFMGPRRAVEDGESIHAAAAPLLESSAPARVVVIDDKSDDAISVSDSDDDVDDLGDSSEDQEREEDEEDDDGDDSSSECCAVSSSDGSVVEDEEPVVMVQVEKRNPSSRSPARAAVTGSGAAALLPSHDLARFLSTLSQLTPPSLTPPEATTDKEAAQQTKDALKQARSATPPPAAADVSEVLSSADDGDEEEAEEDGSTAATSITSSADSAIRSGRTSSDNEEEEEEEEEEAEEEEWDEATKAEDLTWEPFTQRIDPALLLRPLTPPPRTTTAATTASTPTAPSDDAAGHVRTTNSNDDGDDEDADFTPVKLNQPFLSRNVPATSVVVVQSSDDDDDDVKVSDVHLGHHTTLFPAPGVSEITVSPPAATTTTTTTNRGRREQKGKKKNESQYSTSESIPCLSASSRKSVAIVPFDLLHVVELLDCCGVPYVLSPAEADAQCAFLARRGLVDAVFTEDSDVLVHGATTVLRGFFSQAKSVVAYKQSELTACGITKTVLIALASLLGCDYTDGVVGIGLVGALEALVVAWTSAENSADAPDSPSAVLHLLQRWRDLVGHPPHSWCDVDDEMTVAQYALLDSAISQWHSLERRATFPETTPIEAFFAADVDDDATPFTWLPPDWQRMRIFAGALGALSSTWLVQRFELARKECLKREAEAAAASTAGAQESNQRRLTDYGARERVRAEWAFKKQPVRHAAVLSQLRAVQRIH